MNEILEKLEAQFDSEFRRIQNSPGGLDGQTAAMMLRAGRNSARPSALAAIACPKCRIELPQIATVCLGCGTNVA